jgi:hypothetical protein
MFDGTTDPGRTMNNKKHLTAIATTVLLAISGLAAGGPQAATFEPGHPLSPVGQLPLTPVSQQNAVRAAKDYLDYTSFSHSGLITQLTVADGYTPAQAAYGVAAVGL